MAMNIAGGTHHAYSDRGEAFCMLNDQAIGAHFLLDQNLAKRILILDLDVHQGNGTAAIFHNDPEAYTFSIHGEKNFPARKTRSTLDIGLPCGTGDDRYMEVLREALTRAIAESGPDCVFYLAGVDPAEGDRYGRMRLTRDGLERRDRFVLETVRDAGLPIVLLLSGGYAATPVHTAELHAIVFRQAKKVFLAHRSRAATG
mgnify:CR=1 FL=1